MARAMTFGHTELAKTMESGQRMLLDVLAARESASKADQGSRALKAKREISSVTCANGRTLMHERVNFRIDLGELEIDEGSAASFRQLRACCNDRAKQVLDNSASNQLRRLSFFSLDLLDLTEVETASVLRSITDADCSSCKLQQSFPCCI